MGAAPNRGFIAWLGPTCGTWQHANESIGVYATQELWAGNIPEDPRSLCMSWTVAEQRLIADYGDAHGTMRTLLAYDFLGDPLTPLRRPLIPVDVPKEESLDRIELGRAYPNPFNPKTMLRYAVPAQGRVELVIYDIRGRKVRTLVDEYKRPGTYKVAWRGRNDAGQRAASGTYLLRLRAGDVAISRKLVLIK